MQPYITDEMYSSPSDRDKALATHLRALAAKLEYSAKRVLMKSEQEDCLRGNHLHPYEFEESALEAVVVDYIKANYKRIGDISLAYGIIKLVRDGSKVYRG